MPIFFHCECGKPFQTADANAGRRMICTRCGREIGIPEAGSPPDEGIVFIEPAPEPVRTTDKAILSLSSFVCCVMTGIPAILAGCRALYDIDWGSGRLKGRGIAIAGIALGCLGTLLFFGVWYHVLMTPSESARRSQCFGNLKQIGLGLLPQQQSGHFPPAAITDPQGKPLLSWRVALLQFYEQNGLYNRFKLDEPWGSPNNLPLLKEMPQMYQCPSDVSAPEGYTPYQVVVGPGSIFDGIKPPSTGQILDGPANTFLVVESKILVPWTKPDDVDIASIGTALGSKHAGGFNVAFADDSIRFIKQNKGWRILHAFATKDGGEIVVECPY